MRVDLQTLQALQLAHAELHAAESHAEQADCREELNARLGENADAILHDLALLARVQAQLAPWDGRERRSPCVHGVYDGNVWKPVLPIPAASGLASARIGAAPQQAPAVAPAPERTADARQEASDGL